MNAFAKLTTDETIANERDVLSAGGPLESGLYPAKVEAAYIKTSDGGAVALSVILKVGNREVREDWWSASGNTKGNKNYYMDKDGNKQYLPGFLMARSLALLTVGKELDELETETKTIKLYSSEAKAEVPTKVQMMTDLVGQEILVGVIRQTVDKTTKNAEGIYVPTGETRDENTVDKLFRAADRKTFQEIAAQAEASFADRWEAQKAGKTVNRAKGASGGGTAGAPNRPAANSAGKPKTSLFAA